MGTPEEQVDWEARARRFATALSAASRQTNEVLFWYAKRETAIMAICDEMDLADPSNPYSQQIRKALEGQYGEAS